jgi:site-specific DNA-adenine methylase
MTPKAPSPLRYPGGKSRAISQILPLLPPSFRDYGEPFIGGGSVFLAVKSAFQSQVERYWINDLNPDLVAKLRGMSKRSLSKLSGTKLPPQTGAISTTIFSRPRG